MERDMADKRPSGHATRPTVSAAAGYCTTGNVPTALGNRRDSQPDRQTPFRRPDGI